MSKEKKTTPQIFVGWSGMLSRNIAKSLANWLNEFFGTLVYAFHTDNDISSGGDIETTIKEALRASPIGIFCITQDNIHLSDWNKLEASWMEAIHPYPLIIPCIFNVNRESKELERILQGHFFSNRKAVFFYDEGQSKKLIEDINNHLKTLKKGNYAPELLEEMLTEQLSNLIKGIEEAAKAPTSSRESLMSVVRAPLTEWEDAVLLFMQGCSQKDGNDEVLLEELDNFILSEQYTEGEIYQALLLLETRGLVERFKGKPRRYRLTAQTTRIEKPLSARAFRQGYWRKDDN